MATRLLAVLSALLLAGNVFAADAVDSSRYRKMDIGVVPSASGAIDVVEFFSYECRECAALHPFLLNWLASKKDDITFQRIPAARTDSSLAQAKFFYTLESLRLVDKLHEEVYRAYLNDELDFNNEQSIGNWVEKQNMDRVAFLDRFNSVPVYNKAIKAKRLTVRFGIRSTPSLTVGGELVTSSELAGNLPDEMIEVLDRMIEVIRSAPKVPRNLRSDSPYRLF